MKKDRLDAYKNTQCYVLKYIVQILACLLNYHTEMILRLLYIEGGKSLEQ